jgi:molybdopterin-guanine dinucleotide biosynthesis protein A
VTESGRAGKPLETGASGGTLGVVLAGGQSRRFGGPKALVALGGRAMAEWALLALELHSSGQVVVTYDPEVARALGIPGRADRIPGLGPLGGLLTALEWARELGFGRVFLLACDLPLVDPELVGGILQGWPSGLLASVPGSPGPLGFEPLCAGYSVEGLSTADRVARSPHRSMERFLEEIGVSPISLLHLRTKEELALAFTNVNTREDARRAEEFLRQADPPRGLERKMDP